MNALWWGSMDQAARSPRMQAWRGRSGRVYALESESVEHLALDDETLHLVADGGDVLWVGSGADLIADPASRGRLRLALRRADRAFRLPRPADEGERLTTLWDLEHAEPGDAGSGGSA